MRSLWSRLSFRRQLTVMIAAVFLAGGSILILTQHVVLRSLLSEAVTVHNEQRDNAAETVGPTTRDEDAIVIQEHGPAWTQDPVVDEVLAGVQLWAGALLGALTVVAIVAAWLVSRQAIRRISAITDTTNAITEHDLSKRLDLSGPDDEIKRLGSAIDDMIARLEEAFSRQESFIANASHEFRTPLSTARMALQLAIRQGRISDDALPDIQEVLQANRRMEELVNDLLIVAQGRAHVDLPDDPVDLVPMIARAMFEHANGAESANLTAFITLPRNPVFVSGRIPLLRSLITNLVSNSVRHNVTDGFVRIELDVRHARAWFSIENSGSVLDVSTVGRLTEPFHRGERSRIRNEDGSEAGTGLGLTLVESVTELHGGTLALDPRAAGGLRVRVSLPIATRHTRVIRTITD